jgi:PhnB protein
MLTITPNFHFNGNCKQAIELYKKAFGAEVNVMFCNSDANPKDYVANSNEKDLVYHAEILIGNQRLMLTDSIDDKLVRGNSLSLVITFETASDVKTAYDLMADGATIVSSMQSTTYSSCFVSLVDKYGMRWELMTEQTER